MNQLETQILEETDLFLVFKFYWENDLKHVQDKKLAGQQYRELENYTVYIEP